ncbi:MAG TPA: hypothetical protein VHL14_11410 [Steroidobacteraceae bacterium]|jgi:uncharacterized membrane protein YqjE|nr:hypothetical protein [Steroidobacteraceae bacterium]
MHKPQSFAQDIEATADAAITDPLDVIRVLRPVSGELFARLALYSQLLGVEWAEQKVRLLKMLLTSLLGFVSLLCVMVFTGILVMALSWDSIYRIPAIIAVIGFYGAIAGIAWHRFSSLSALSDQAFVATREEFATDIALIKSKL